ncbi:RagB/SusD family nutrient uptake outer membrane protein [Pontibacter sp. MBLB2868]|uniref:RagB/SusD family nutrient uptake outer membrane protein n=1 Tax=Pontibacter sp. MBLB2868 TaxID=3451555 RepID=UPI003F752EE2
MKVYKNFRYVALSLGLLFATSACDSMLDVQPKDELVADIALENLNDFKLALNGVYSGLTSGSYYGAAMEIDLAYVSDNARRSTDNRGQGAELYNYTFNASTGDISAIWAAVYRVIDRTNIILTRIDEVEGSQAEKDQIKGEALAARALAYHDLVRLYAKPYDATPDASHMGVPILLESKISEPARNTVKEVYDQINADLLAAKGLLQDASVPTRFTTAAANALLARVALYQKNYAKVVEYSTAALSAKGVANKSTFANMWEQGNAAGEAYFKLPMPVGSSRVGEAFYEVALNTAFINPTQDLLALYNKDADVRYTSYFTNIPGREAGENIVTKYTDPNASNTGLSDIVLLRAGEMLLSRAEAYANLGQNDLALADLNALRANRIEGYTAVTDLTGQTLKDAIITERRKELAYEGHRYFDIKRLNLTLSRGADCSAAPQSNCTIPAGNFRFTFPIPQDEVFANKNIVQNEGYLQ